ncbi:MAG: Ig-like domain-containing protein [Lachnospiraceae bacterium]
MKAKISMLLAAVMVVCTIFSPIGNQTQVEAAAKAKLQKTAISINIGAIKVSKPKVVILNKKKSATYQYISSNKKVATVDKNGVVKAIKVGQGTITVKETYKKKTVKVGTCKIKVKEEFAREFVKKAPLERIMEKIYEGVSIELPKVWNKKIDSESSMYYLGIKNTDLEQGIASEAMINVIPYSVCLVRVKDGSDVEQVKTDIKENVDPRKWVCVSVEPENVKVSSIGNVILLVMTNEGSQEIVDSFQRLNFSELPKAFSGKTKRTLIRSGDYYSTPMEDYNSKSIKNMGKKISGIVSKYLKNAKSVHYAIIPDKSYFIKNSYFSKDEYEKMFRLMKKSVKGAKEISIEDSLSLSDYYKTDLHWRQEKIVDTVNVLGSRMNFRVSSGNYDKKTLKKYRGVYTSSISGKVPNESLHYLVNSTTKKAKVSIYGQSGTSKVYNTKKLSSDVPYDVFLSGPNPIVTITVPKTSSKRELVIFGDSFSSSMAPLLLNTYKKITVIDLRFVSSKYLSNFMSFNSSQEVLFLYNTTVVNNSFMLK